MDEGSVGKYAAYPVGVGIIVHFIEDGPDCDAGAYAVVGAGVAYRALLEPVRIAWAGVYSSDRPLWYWERLVFANVVYG